MIEANFLRRMRRRMFEAALLEGDSASWENGRKFESDVFVVWNGRRFRLNIKLDPPEGEKRS